MTFQLYFRKKRDTKYEIRDTFFSSCFMRYEIRDTFFSSPFTRYEIRDARYASRSAAGFTLIEMIGVLAVMATLMAIIAPTVLDQIDRAEQDAEARSLQSIGTGVELYLRQNFAWPANLAALSPDYVAIGNTQLTTNSRGYARYFFVHPTTSGYDNAVGLTSATLSDARYLLISNVSSDAAPTITDATQFNTWWNTDTTTTPDLKIYRGHVASLFHLVSISAVGQEGSYRIHGTATNGGNGGTLAMRATYHLAGTVVEFDEDFNFSPGNFAFGFSLTSDVGYQFDPACTAGTQWHVLGTSCS